MSSAPAKPAFGSNVVSAGYPWLAATPKEEKLTQTAHPSPGKSKVPQIEVISAEPHWIELLIPCTRDAAERIQPFLTKLDADLSDDLRRTVGIALRELLQNAIEWGGQLDPSRKVRVAHLRFPRMLLYHISDPGPGFSFQNLRHAVVGHSAPEEFAEVALKRDDLGMRPGGYGIALSQAIADELVYNEAQNEVVLIKYLARPSAAESSR
jgi:anti-sigma regulatory factor (Ser/Thr protein kinase)